MDWIALDKHEVFSEHEFDIDMTFCVKTLDEAS